jgi:hypothetical protein
VVVGGVVKVGRGELRWHVTSMILSLDVHGMYHLIMKYEGSGGTAEA